jgi:aspartyl/glutamyl-tRNA(Asn/Gln) amidotransferase C subunit
VALTRADVEHAAALAGLTLEPGEVARLARELTTLLDHFSALRAVDLHGVEPYMLEPSDATPPRDDDRGADELVLPPADIAPGWREGYFTVPRLPAQRAVTTGTEGLTEPP